MKKAHIIKVIFFLLFFSPTIASASPTSDSKGMDCGDLKNGECSPIKPIYCDNGVPVANCTKCGCEKNYVCNSFTNRCQEMESLEIVILSERGTEKNPFSKRKENKIEFQVRESETSKPLHKNRIQKMEVLLDGNELGVNALSNQKFEAIISPKYREKNVSELQFKILGTVNKTISFDRTMTVFFKNETIVLNPLFERAAFFQGEKIGLIKFDPKYVDENLVEFNEIKAILKREDKNLIEKTAIEETKLFFDYAISEKDGKKGLKIKITGTDSYGSTLNKTIKVPVKKEKNPLFNLEIQPTQKVFARGASIKVKAFVHSSKETLLENLRVWIESKDPDKNKPMNSDKEKNSYWQEINLPGPNAGKTKTSFIVNGSAELKGKKLFYSEKKQAILTKKIGAKFVYPKEGPNTLKENEIKSVDVNLYCFPGIETKLEKAIGVLKVDGKSQEITLLKNSEGLYTASLKKPISSGEHALELNLTQGLVGSTGVIHVDLKKDVNPFLFIGITVSIIFAFILFNYLQGHLRKKREQTEKERFKIIKRKRLLKELKKEYYKRHISEEEYRDRIMGVQRELKALTKEKKPRKKRAGGEKKTAKKTKKKGTEEKKPQAKLEEPGEGKKAVDDIEKRIEEIKKKREKGLPL